MALTSGDVAMWAELARLGLIPDSPRVLEIGQANWFGDVPPPEGCEAENSWDIARKFYRKALNFSSLDSVDMNGRDSLAFDLNEPLPFDGLYDIVINTGTAEHVFDQRQVMETVHDYCEVGGLMIHAAPWQGWNDHGFYLYQPCFFRDLARANGYEIVYSAAWQAHFGVMMYLAMKKMGLEPFKVPQQGKYEAVGV